MQNKDLVTIVVPAYNAEAFLKENIESILGQTYKNLEVVYVCDGCTDNTVDILMQYTEDSRLKVCVETDNQGAAISRNIGMSMAKGDWIIFLDADDLFESNMIEEMVECAIKEHADMCCCYLESFDDVPNEMSCINNGIIKLYCKTYPIIETKKEERHILQLIVDKGPCTKLVHKSIYMKEEVCFQNIQNANDVYYTMVSAINTQRIVYVDKVFVHYRSNKGRRTLSTMRNLKKNYIFEAFDKVYDYILGKNNKYLRRSFYNSVFSNVFDYINKPIYPFIIDSLRETYFEKWGMHSKNVINELSCINKVLYKTILNTNREIDIRELNKQAKIEFIRMMSQKGCSIWGTGIYGCELLGQISNTDIQIQHVFDSSKEKWGKKICGYMIENFEETKADNIIVTTPKYYDEIREQIGNRAENILNIEQQIIMIPS